MHFAVRQRSGYNPENCIGGDGNKNFRAVKVGTSASSRISTTRSSSAPATSRSGPAAPHCARTGAPDELDLDGTIKGTATRAIDILMRPGGTTR